jgi:ComF family protein
LDRALQVVLPAHCVGCGAVGTYLGDVCAAAAERPANLEYVGGERSYGTLAASFAYRGVARTAALRLKYANLHAIAPAMASPMAKVLPWHSPFDLLVPVPLDPSRLRGRGFNQTAVLAKGVARRIDVPFDGSVLHRVAHGLAQVGSTPPDRRDNVENAFGTRHCERIAGLTVLIDDDDVTTGRTMESSASVLRSSGAETVQALCFARRTAPNLTAD